MSRSPDTRLNEDAASRFDAMIARRLEGEPVSRIIGTKEFYGRTFAIDRHTLDPRPDTETLIDAVLDTLRREGRLEEKLRILDLGTGTGCILLTLLAELPFARGVGSDVSAGALDIARRNARELGVGDRASFVAGDWFAPIEGSFDIVRVQSALYCERRDRGAFARGELRPAACARWRGRWASRPIGGLLPAWGGSLTLEV